MIFSRLNPKGIHPREVTGVREIEAALSRATFCAGWFGFTNLLLRKRNLQGERREIDIVLFVHDRVIIIDLKDWGGKVTNQGAIWLHKGKRRGQSASLKIEENAHILKTLLQAEAPLLRPTPWIDHFVVFTASDVDISDLSENDKTNSFLLPAFISLLTDRVIYEQRFPPRSTGWTLTRPLTSPPASTIASEVFKEGGPFLAREASFAEHEALGNPTFEHPKGVWEEYFTEHRTNHSSTGLLRIWNSERLPTEYSALEARWDLLQREQTVLGYLRDADPDLEQEATLPWRARDEEFGMRFWELFELRRTARRLYEHLNANPAMTLEHRCELMALVLARAAGLHRRRIAHRDIGGHSLWIEPESSRIRYSAFGAAHFPGSQTVGDTRLALLAAGEPLPEDRAVVPPGTAFNQDVFLLGVAGWRILVGTDVPRTAGMARPGEQALSLLPEPLHRWLQKGLATDPKDRFPDAIAMAWEFDEAAGRHVAAGLAAELQRHRTDRVPYLTWPPTRQLTSHRAQAWVSETASDAVVVKLWPGSINRSEQSVRVLAFFETASRLAAARPPWTPDIVEAGWGTAGLYLVSKFVAAATYDEFLSGASGADVLRMVCNLVKVVADMHARNLSHGDLKPANVLVVRSSADCSPILVDVVDLPPEGAESLSTPAYAPPGGDANPRERDAYAVGKMLHEALSSASGSPQVADDLAARLIRAAAATGRAHPILDELLAEIDRPPPPSRAPELELFVGVRDLRNQTELLPDNSEFHVVVEPGARILQIVGLDQRLQIFLDDEGSSVSCSVLDAAPRTIAWAIKERLLSFKGTIALYSDDQGHPGDGIAALLTIPQVVSAISAARANRGADAINEPDDGDFDEETPLAKESDNSGGVASEPSASRRWQVVLAAEEDAVPFVIASERVKRDMVAGVHFVSCNEMMMQFDVGSRETIKVSRNGRQIAELDLAQTRGDRLALVKYRGAAIAPGDRLDLQSAENRASFTRRQQAVARIVARAGVLPNLLDHFGTNATTPVVPFEGAAPTREDLAPYGLNDEQIGAFLHFWSNGPIGLLQGPPGTGKSRFIGAFVHWVVKHGGMRRVLVLSQSHGAANTVSESILKAAMACGEPVDLLRVGQIGRVTDALLPFHSDSIQARYGASFEARSRDRIAIVGRSLGLPPLYVEELHELEASIVPIIDAIARREAEVAESAPVEDHAIAVQRLEMLRSAYRQLLDQFADGRDVEPTEVMRTLRDELASRHSVTNSDARIRVVHAIGLSTSWLGALSGRRQGMEEFLTRTRPIVCGTCVGIGRPAINVAETEFDLVVIDEAARCDPGELAVGLQSARRVLLVGDHRQLPPLFDRVVAKSAAAMLGLHDTAKMRAVEALSISDFERSFNSPYGKKIGRTLRTQYRMAPEISALVSECFYADVGLKNGRGPPGPHYRALPTPLDREVTWLDTSALGLKARDRAEGTSFSNTVEVSVIIQLLRSLAGRLAFWNEVRRQAELAEGEPAIGVIAMYSAQKRALLAAFEAADWPEGFAQLVRIDTVDAYQAKENRIVIVSLVRSAPPIAGGRKASLNPLPHATDYRRVNVALSRAMERLIVVGAADLFGTDWTGNSLRTVLGHLRERGRVLPSAILEGE